MHRMGLYFGVGCKKKSFTASLQIKLHWKAIKWHSENDEVHAYEWCFALIHSLGKKQLQF